MRRCRSWVLTLLALAVTGTVLAQEIPTNDGWVTDLAGFLNSRQEQSLEALMESYKVGSDNEIALLTVPTLGRRSLEQFSLEVARAWGIGEKDRHNGALLLIARQERKIRIEVGRGLEGNLTDSISGRIIRDVIGPEFKSGRFYEGLRAGIEATHAAAGGDYGKIPERGRKKGGGTIAGLLPLIFFIFLLARLARRGGRGGGGGGLGGILPWLLLGSMTSGRRHSGGWHGGSGGGLGGGGFGGFGGGGGFSGGGASGGW